MTIEGVDFANQRPSGQALAAAGIKYVIRYLSPNTVANPAKKLTPEEITDYRAAGLDIGLVWETSTDRATTGRANGQTDARLAMIAREQLDIPDDVSIFFVCQDQGGITGPQTAPYFQGINDEMPLNLIGTYGGSVVYKYLRDHNLVTWTWQARALSWSGMRWDPTATIQQYANGVTVAGKTVDRDRALVADWGQWKAQEDSMPIEESSPSYVDLTWRVEAMANLRDVYGNGSQKGKPVPLTLAIKELQNAVAALTP